MINLKKGQKRQGKGEKNGFQGNIKKLPYQSRKFLFSVWNILTKKTKLNSCSHIMTSDAQFYNLVMQVKIDGLFEGESISKICFYSNKSWSIFKKY